MRREDAGRALPRAQLAELLLDTEPDPVMLVTESTRVVFANIAARSLGAGAAVRIAGDRLATARAVDAPRLTRVLVAACAGQGSTLSLEADGGAARLEVRGLGSAALASIRLIDPAVRLERALAAMASQCGLTPSERALAQALAEGVLAPEHARRRGVAISTVRSQVQHLLRKTGATSQVEFLARLRAQAA